MEGAVAVEASKGQRRLESEALATVVGAMSVLRLRIHAPVLSLILISRPRDHGILKMRRKRAISKDDVRSHSV